MNLAFLNQRKHNHRFSFNDEYRFIKKNELVDNALYRLVGCYTTQTKYGRQAVFVFDDKDENKNRVSLSCDDIVDLILDNENLIQEINAGKIGIKFCRKHSGKYGCDYWIPMFENL